MISLTKDTLAKFYMLGLFFCIFASVACAWFYPNMANIRNWQIILTFIFILVLFKKRLHPFAIDMDSREQKIAHALFILCGFAFVVSAILQYLSFHTNAYDFTTFDSFLYNTYTGRPFHAAVWEVNHLFHHQTYNLLLLVPLHYLFHSHYFLLVMYPLIVWSATFPLWRLASHYVENRFIAFLVPLALLTCSWAGRITHTPFHPEAVYLPAGLWFAYGWVKKRPVIWSLAYVFFITTREDGALYFIAFAIGILVFTRENRKPALLIFFSSILMFLVNFGVIKPYLLEVMSITQIKNHPLQDWHQYGDNLTEIVLTMLQNPLPILSEILLHSKWYAFFGSLLFLPFLSKITLLPLFVGMLILGTGKPDMQAYLQHYSVLLLPFALWGLLEAYAFLKNINRQHHFKIPARGLLIAALALFSLSGSQYLRFKTPQWAMYKEIRQIEQDLQAIPLSLICVQTTIFPHLAYELYAKKIRRISEKCLAKPRAIGLIHPNLPDMQTKFLELSKVYQGDKARYKTTATGFILFTKTPLF